MLKLLEYMYTLIEELHKIIHSNYCNEESYL
jgi:hypothetical protein